MSGRDSPTTRSRVRIGLTLSLAASFLVLALPTGPAATADGPPDSEAVECGPFESIVYEQFGTLVRDSNYRDFYVHRATNALHYRHYIYLDSPGANLRVYGSPGCTNMLCQSYADGDDVCQVNWTQDIYIAVNLENGHHQADYWLQLCHLAPWTAGVCLQ